MADGRFKTVLEPHDEHPHEPDEASNYNESMYLNGFDPDQEVGGWFRLGNRVNEGYAEMSVCLYLPGGRVGFMFARPKIETNEVMAAGGLTIDVVEPFAHLRVAYDGDVVLLDEPADMADPRAAFRDNPHETCSVRLDVHGISPMYGGRTVFADGSEVPVDPETSFAKAHYEQHTRVRGTIRVGDEVVDLDGLGLRDKSWGPRHWQALTWYRWLPMAFDDGFAMMLSVIGDGAGGARRSGMVLEDGRYHRVVDCRVDSDWDERHHQTAMRCWARTDAGREYEVTGEVISLIPLRNRRTGPDGVEQLTRITEAMTRFRFGSRTGIGMSEYLDQIVDGAPVGDDLRAT